MAEKLDGYLGRPLIGHVLISRTVPRGQYSSIKVEVMLEFDQSKTTFEAVFDDLAERLHTKLLQAGVVTS